MRLFTTAGPLLLLYVLSSVTPLLAVSQPDSVTYHHLQITVETGPEGQTIRGVAAWQFSANQTDELQLQLHAIRTEIYDVLINERPADFYLRNDTLLVTPQEILRDSSSHKLEIIYRAETTFSMHRADSMLYATSFLPGATANLFPAPAIQNLQVPVDIRVLVPSTWKAVANGAQTANILLPEGQRLFHWKTRTPAPVSQIGITTGLLEQYDALSDGSPIRLFVQPGTLDTAAAESLLQTIRSLTMHAEQVTATTLPFDGLNVVYLHDHHWELAPFGPGLVVITENGGDVNAQLLRGLSQQWAGSYLMAKESENPDFMVTLQAMLAHEIAQKAGIAAKPLEPEDMISTSSRQWSHLDPRYWNTALVLTNPRSRDLLEESHRDYLNQLNALFPSIFDTPAGVLDWQHAARLDSLNSPSALMAIDEANVPVAETYTVIYDFDEATGKYMLELVPEQTYPQRYLTLEVRQFSDGSVYEMDVLASNLGDRLHLSTSGYVENMYVFNDDPLVRFDEIKPAAFWLYQLRRDVDPARRIESAEGFGRVRNDPDVQLILQDLIRNEPDATVKAALVRSLSQIVGGAFGTHQRFLDLLGDESRAVRQAALDALANYTSNEAVEQRVFRIISQSQDIPFVNRALGVYAQIVDEQEMYSVGRSLLFEDREDLLFTETIIPLVASTTQGEVYAPNLMDYLTSDYPFTLRSTAFEALLPLEIEAEYWAEILPDLLNDADPRIRYMALDKISMLPASQRQETLDRMLFNEYDVRVLSKVKSLRPG